MALVGQIWRGTRFVPMLLCGVGRQASTVHVSLASAYDPFPNAGHVGGVENVLRHFAQGLHRLGHKVTVVCGGKGDSEEGGVQVRRVPSRLTVMRAPIVDLRDRIPDSDVVHVAGTYPFVTSPVLRAAKRRDIPAVLDFHFEPDPTTWLGRLAAHAYRQIGPRAYEDADRVLVRSLEYGRHAPSLQRVPEAKWSAVPNGVDTDRFRPDGARQGDGNLLFVGRLVPYKGLNVLLRALSQMPEAPPLWIAGSGPLRSSLQALATRLGVDVTFLGRVADDALPSLYRGASLTVLPSIGRQECFGITLLESMACGTPVLAADLPGVRAVARLGGRTAPAGDVQGWARALTEALDHPIPGGADLARQIRSTCGWPAIVARLESIYQGMT